MYIQYSKSVSNGKEYIYPLLCRKYREDGKIKTEVVSNLSRFPEEVVLAIKSVLDKSKSPMIPINEIIIEKSVDYGFVYALISLMKSMNIKKLFDKFLGDKAVIAQLIIIGKIVTRGSKLEIYNWIQRNAAIANKLGIDVNKLRLDDLYETLVDVQNLQEKIEKKWWMYNKGSEKQIYLYDITSVYFEGVTNAFSKFGYNRDKKKGKMQMVVGLITDSEGMPLNIKVFEGNINDHTTVIDQLRQLKEEYGAKDVIFVGDRGMRIRYNLEQMEAEEKEGIAYITALSTEEIRTLLKSGTIQLNLFSKELVEIEEEGVRYVLCNNPMLEKEKTQKRNDLRVKFEEELCQIQLAYKNRQIKNESNKEKIKKGNKNKKLVTCFNSEQIDSYKYRCRKLQEKYRMQSFYQIEITENIFTVIFSLESYSEAKQLDGKYVIITSVSKQLLDTKAIREQYKNLKYVEHAFRDLKTVRLNIRPVFHTNEDTTRGHVFLSMFSYAIIREFENRIFPLLKQSNKKKNEQLSMTDLIEELKMVKLVILKLGRKYKKVQITELTQKQIEILNALSINKAEMEIM